MTTAIFPVRAQPPHLGHILTIVKIYGDYDKIIIHVFDMDEEIPARDVADVFSRIYQYMSKIEVIVSKEGFRFRKRFDDLPYFDVIVSGNRVVLDNVLNNSSHAVRFVPRSEFLGYDISGSELKRLKN